MLLLFSRSINFIKNPGLNCLYVCSWNHILYQRLGVLREDLLCLHGQSINLIYPLLHVIFQIFVLHVQIFQEILIILNNEKSLFFFLLSFDRLLSWPQKWAFLFLFFWLLNKFGFFFRWVWKLRYKLLIFLDRRFDRLLRLFKFLNFQLLIDHIDHVRKHGFSLLWHVLYLSL